jgi:RNA-directed DNA polymerase
VSLRSLVSSAGEHYKPFVQAQRTKPFRKNVVPPKTRRIDNPSKELKTIQRRIYDRLLKPLDLPAYILGGVPGKRTVDNARLHLGAKVLIRVDIAHFFPSVTNHQVYEVWRDLLGCSSRIARLLTRLTTFERRLPQGAPTSTLLANLVLLMMDEPIRSECESFGIRYSSWVDDLAFSSDNPRGILNTVIATLQKSGFTISRRKLAIMGPREPKILNGVLLGNSPGIPRERISCIRSGIHKLRTRQVTASDVDNYVMSLRGSIAHVRSIAPQKAQKLSRLLDVVLKECNALRDEGQAPRMEHHRSRPI